MKSPKAERSECMPGGQCLLEAAEASRAKAGECGGGGERT